MREIKFRAWGIKYKEMTEKFSVLNAPGMINRRIDNGDKFVILQFTGLHDKNGKEIFEGDLVLNHRNAHSKEILQVKWQEGESKQADDGIWWTHKKPGFVFERINPGMHTVYVAEKDFEVIGNIFENEDLLS